MSEDPHSTAALVAKLEHMPGMREAMEAERKRRAALTSEQRAVELRAFLGSMVRVDLPPLAGVAPTPSLTQDYCDPDASAGPRATRQGRGDRMALAALIEDAE